MSLKAVLFDFNGVIINDESIHQELVGEILLTENLRPSTADYQEVCLGRSDRVCLRDILARRGRIVSDEYLDKLIRAKANAYRQRLEGLTELPIYPGLKDFLEEIRAKNLLMAIVTGALGSEVELVLERASLASYFSLIISGDQIKASKPQPDGYLLAVEFLNQKFSYLNLQPANCLVIEDSFAGIQAAKNAGMQVVGVANTYPLHILQRRANWVVDYLAQLELDWVADILARN
jgi:HAD superfamily hydrolase (TIGR01509 family)